MMEFINLKNNSFIKMILILCFCVIVFDLFAHNAANAGNLVIKYGFEDWDGWSANTSPADGWIFTQPAESYFTDCRDSTIGTTGGVSCDSNTAYAGSYYMHTQYSTGGGSDLRLGRTASSVNHRLYIGYNGGYPTSGTHDTTDFSTAITSGTATLRFRFRVTGNWTSSQTGIDDGGGQKWIRWGASGDFQTDTGSLLIKIQNSGDDLNPSMLIRDFNPGGTPTGTTFTNAGNWQDGEWHSFCLVAVDNSSGNYTISVWVDDWDMENSYNASRNARVDVGLGGFHLLALNGNWSGQYPSSLMGMDYDDIEVWDGLPDEHPTLPPVTVNDFKNE